MLWEPSSRFMWRRLQERFSRGTPICILRHPTIFLPSSTRGTVQGSEDLFIPSGQKANKKKKIRPFSDLSHCLPTGASNVTYCTPGPSPLPKPRRTVTPDPQFGSDANAVCERNAAFYRCGKELEAVLFLVKLPGHASTR